MARCSLTGGAAVVARRTRGLTLVEVLVVVAIVAVLAALTFSVLGRVRERAKVTACAANLRQIGQALHLYAAANDDYAPPVHTRTLKHPDGSIMTQGDPKRWRDLLAKFTNNTDVFYCPADPRARTSQPDPGVYKFDSLYTSYGMGPIVNGVPGPDGSVLISLSSLPHPHISYASDRLFIDATLPPKEGTTTVHGARQNLLHYDGRVENIPVTD